MEGLVALCVEPFFLVVLGRYSRRPATDHVYPTANDFSFSILSGRHAKTLLKYV